MDKICQYCGSEREANETRCTGCDAASFGDPPAQRFYEGKPFHYNGYVIWYVEDLLRLTAEYLFYLGDRLVERIVLDRDVLRKFVPESCDEMLFIWDLFELAQGGAEALLITEQNTTRPALFEIRCVPSPKEEWLAGLTRRQVLDALVNKEVLIYDAR